MNDSDKFTDLKGETTMSKKENLNDEKLKQVNGGVGNTAQYRINQDRCTKCGECANNCPLACISFNGSAYSINHDKCVWCGACVDVCNHDAIFYVD